MSFTKRFTHEYHDSDLVSVAVGPRRELRLSIRLDPVWNGGTQTEVTVSLSSIANYHQVAAFVAGLVAPRPAGFIDQIVGLKWTPAGNVLLDLARHGAIEIVGPKALET